MSHPLLTDIIRKLDCLEKKISSIQRDNQQYLALDDAAQYLCISKSTLYKHTAEGNIPFFKPNGKLILFSKSDLDDWISKRKIYSNNELIKKQSHEKEIK